MRLTAVIADDEPLMLEALQEALMQVCPDLEIVATATHGANAYQAIMREKPDVAFLDINMPGMTGLHVADAVQAHTQVVFVTAHDKYAVDAFQAGAVDYLLKPIELHKLSKVLNRLYERSSRRSSAQQPAYSEDSRGLKTAEEKPARLVWIKALHRDEVRLIHIDDVIFFEADTKYIRVVTMEGESFIRMPLKQLVERIDGQLFWQIHRGSVVNVRRVARVMRDSEGMTVLLKGLEHRLRVSTQYQALFKHM